MPAPPPDLGAVQDEYFVCTDDRVGTGSPSGGGEPFHDIDEEHIEQEPYRGGSPRDADC